MNEKQQTAVEWFADQLGITSGTMLEKALIIQQDQLILAHIAGQEHKTPFIYDYDEAEQYFTDTYQTEP